MNAGAVRAICFDLDDTLWEIEPVLERAERILADWLLGRYPRIAEHLAPARYLDARAALLAAEPQQAHDFTYLRRETLARLAHAAGLDHRQARALAHEAFDVWHAARCEVTPYDEVIPALVELGAAHRLATLSNGNADLARIGLAHHFEVNLAAAALGCAKPDPRAYTALADRLTLKPAEILFVGDDPHADVAGPRAVGMQTVWVNRGTGVWPDALPAADARVANLGELVRLLMRKV